MLVRHLSLQNIKSFHSVRLDFRRDYLPVHWVTLLGENGTGKSTALQALALLLAGPEAAQKLSPRPVGWLADESHPGRIEVEIEKGERDPGKFGERKVSHRFTYSYHVTGSEPLSVDGTPFSDPAIVEITNPRLTWLRQNAFGARGTGWFAVGYGPFRRLTRSQQILVPTLEPQARFTNFITQFNEDEPLSAFERWMIYLDYRLAKEDPATSRSQRDRAIAAINKLLPDGSRFDSITPDGRILYRVAGRVVPTMNLSDGYRSMLALAGDLVWRLLTAFPASSDALAEEGVVLVDELDIHLHPKWQRQIAGWLREQFRGLQFIVGTHSPLVAIGAGEDALTLRLDVENGQSRVRPLPNVASMNVERALLSEAFGLDSAYAPATQALIDEFDELAEKGGARSAQDAERFDELRAFMQEARPLGGPPEPGSLDERIERYLLRTVND